MLLCLPVAADAFPDDKIQHMSISATLSFSALRVFDDYDNSWLYAHASTLAFGIAKELYDEFDYGGFSKRDLVADFLGSLAGSFLYHQFESGLGIDFDPLSSRARVQLSF